MKPSVFSFRLPGSLKAYLALLVVYLVWGTTLGAIHIAVQSIEPAVLGSLRFLIGGFLLIGFSLLRGERFPELASFKREFIIGFLLFFGGNSISLWAVQHLPTGLAGTLVATTPFWMMALAAMIPPCEKISAKAIGGLIIGFSGLLMLLYPRMATSQPTDPAFLLSLVGILVMVFFWALGSTMVRKLPSRSSILMGLGIQNTFAGLLLLPIVALTSHPLNFHPSMEGLLALGYLILFGTIIGTACYYFTLSRLSVPIASTFAYVTPLVTIVFGWLFLHEVVTGWTLAGTSVILIGVIIVQMSRETRAKPTAPVILESPPRIPSHLLKEMLREPELMAH